MFLNAQFGWRGIGVKGVKFVGQSGIFYTLSVENSVFVVNLVELSVQCGALWCGEYNHAVRLLYRA